ncbi:MAG: YihA family ribosome biogenesis GTP-binding protein [Chitinophagaceae bacterium]
MRIIEAKYVTSSPSVEKCPKADNPEYAFIGRSNVGKSSLINVLAGQNHLAKTSATPGKTQLINHFTIVSVSGKQKKQNWWLVDLPGYGYAKISQKQRKTWEKMIEDYLRKRPTLVNVFVLIDSRHEPQANDLEFINNLGQWQIPFVIVFTKADKNKPGATKRNVDLFIGKMKESWEEIPPYFVSSAITRQGYEDILNFIEITNDRLVQ